jgi:hypothetical protein
MQALVIYQQLVVKNCSGAKKEDLLVDLPLGNNEMTHLVVKLQPQRLSNDA